MISLHFYFLFPSDLVRFFFYFADESSAIGYPIVDSFPPIFSPPSSPSAVALHTRLFTAHSTGMAEALRRIRGVVSAPGRVGVDEREALVNGLDEIEDAYRHAWQDDSDDGDDDA